MKIFKMRISRVFPILGRYAPLYIISGHSVCMVKNNSRIEEQNDDSLCSKTFKSIFTTNLKLHLKKNMLKSTSSLKRKRRKNKRKETIEEKPKVIVLVQIRFHSKQI